ncbi:MAG: magnesium and cobalt transport protein CorA [Promicromonosporaceae bacterium]|nr:magnesium and cobalt transport protein CorA [Promicromonosporaceae bacterium]
MSITDNAVYVDGLRASNPPSLDLTLETMQECDGIGWIDMLKPSPEEIREVAEELGLHELAVDDAVNAHQRSKLERYDDVLFLVTHPARYLDGPEQVEFSELHVFVGPTFVVSVRRSEFPHVSPVRHDLESRPDRLRLGPLAILHALLDRVVDEYAPVVAGLENDIDEIENQLFSRDPQVSRRIYELAREVMTFQRATRPLVQILRSLETGSMLRASAGTGAPLEASELDVELQRAFRDVLDHAIRYADRADEFRAILDNALSVHATLVAQEQNEEMRHMTEASLKQAEAAKKISSWAAIFFAPTLVAGIYGMNFHNMPELSWPWGYPFALGLMVVAGFVLYRVFKHVDWL